MPFLIIVVVVIVVISGCLKGFREESGDAEGKCFAGRRSRLSRSNFVPIAGLEKNAQLEVGSHTGTGS